jgi:hypothetical protein
VAFDAGSIAAKLTLDRSGFSSSLSAAKREADAFSGDVASQMRSVGGAMMGVGGMLTAGITLPIVGAAAAAIKLGSDAEETGAKFQTVFGSQTTEMNRWIEDLQTIMPATTAEMQEMAASMNLTLEGMGLNEAEAARMSQGIVTLSGDLASFNNIPVEDSLNAIASAFRGEYDALQRFVPAINAAAVEQTALEMGLAGSAGELDAQAKALAINAILMQSTTDAQGDMARTAGSAANQFRRVWANTRELGTEFGQLLLPAVTVLAQGFNWLLGGLLAMPRPLQYITIGVAGLAAIVPVLVLGLGGLIWAAGTISLALAPGGALAIGLPIVTGLFGTMAALVTGTVIPALFGMGAAMWASLGPVGLVVAGVALLAGAAYLIYRNWGSIVEFFGGVWEGISRGAAAVGAWLIGGWATTVADGVTGVIEWLVGAVTGFFAGLPDRFLDMGTNAMLGLAAGIYEAARMVWDAIVWVVGEGIRFGWEMLKPGSPSRVFAAMGMNAAGGLAAGMLAGAPLVRQAAGEMMGSAMGGSARLSPAVAAPAMSVAMPAIRTANAERRRGRRPGRQRPIVLNINIGGKSFQEEVSSAVYEAVRREIIGGAY